MTTMAEDESRKAINRALRAYHARMFGHDMWTPERLAVHRASKYRPVKGVGPYWKNLRVNAQGRVVNWS